MSAGARHGARMASVAVVVVWVGLWAWAVQRGWISQVFLASPLDALRALAAGIARGDWAHLAFATIERMACGWLLACAAGLLLGALIGISPALRAWLQPMLEVLRPLPASALMPVAIALMGLTPAMVLVVIAFGSVWPVLLATVHGFANIEPRLNEVARVLRLSRAGFIVKIGLPSALPDALAGMRLALTISLILAVVGEMLASQPGLGQTILLAARSFRSADLFGGVMLLGLIGWASNALVSLLERRALRWQQR